MRRFISRNDFHAVSNPTLKAAAEGDPTFVVQFLPVDGVGTFETDSNAVADALAALIDAGKLVDVREVIAEPVVFVQPKK